MCKERLWIKSLHIEISSDFLCTGGRIKCSETVFRLILAQKIFPMKTVYIQYIVCEVRLLQDNIISSVGVI